MTASTLQVTLGQSSLTGARPHNEDFCAAVTPEGEALAHKGLLAAVADGLGGHAAGREASEYTVRGLLADYYATPDTWSITDALDKVISAQNRWLQSHAARSRETVGMATTLSVLVLRGRRFVSAHVGDSRIVRLRGGELTRLTTDHVWEHPELSNVLSRAIGLDKQLSIDFGEGELAEGDVFALLTDGVWGALDDARIAALLAGQTDAQAAATALAQSAVSAGAADNCTALVLRVEALPATSLADSLAAARSLPLPPLLAPGQSIDGLEVEAVLHASRVTLLYRVRDLASGAQRVLKTLRAEADDRASIAALVHEEWLARRVVGDSFPHVLSHPGRRHLYYLMSWHEGASLAAMLAHGRHFAVAEVLDLGGRLLRGVAALHRMAIVHRDIKPDNLHLGDDGRLRILDLGVAASDAGDEADPELRFSEINNPGTPSYMAPECVSGGAPASEASDLYAVGVSLYHLLTRHYPYGEIEPFQHPRYGDPIPPTRYRPDIPDWFEAIVLKACAREPEARFETAEEFLLALERGAHRPLVVRRHRPLAERNPLRLWQAIGIAALLLDLVLLFLLSRG